MSRAIIAFALTVLTSTVAAQSPPTVVGAWRLVSFAESDASGRTRLYWDDKASGLIIYTADGLMTAQLYDARRPRLGVRWELADADAARVAYVGLISYFGTYAVDEASSTITHTVQGAMVPDWIGTKLIRGYRFLSPDRMELRVLTDAGGQRAARGSVLVWERVRG